LERPQTQAQTPRRRPAALHRWWFFQNGHWSGV